VPIGRCLMRENGTDFAIHRACFRCASRLVKLLESVVREFLIDLHEQSNFLAACHPVGKSLYPRPVVRYRRIYPRDG
jgi:hypothetical protein